MTRFLRRLTIVGRLWLVATIATVCLAGVTAVSLHVLESRSLEERNAKVRATVETVHGILAHHGALAEAGKMTRDEAQKAALETIRALRYDEREYFWINDTHPTMIMHPVKPELEGKDLSAFADPTGKKLFAEFVRTAQSEPAHAGFVSYLWPKPGSSEPVRKTSFVRLYAPWGWIVGSGVYLDDVEAAMAAELGRAYGAAALVAALLVASSFLAARGVKRAVTGLRREATRLETAAREGRLSDRPDPASVEGEFRGVVEGMGSILEAIREPVQSYRDFILQLADGRVPPRREQPASGDFEAMRQAQNKLLGIVEMRNADTQLLVQAALEGRLDVRADTGKYSGYDGALIGKINSLLDAVVAPVRIAAEYVQRISKGDIPPKITDDWPGDFSKLRDNLNECIDALSGLLAAMARMAEQHTAGDTEAAVDESKFQGAYGNLAAGVNAGIRTYVRILQEALAILGAYSGGDFEPELRRLPGKQAAIHEKLGLMRSNLKSFSAEMQALSSAAIAGKLSARADAAKYQGDWQKLVKGVNDTLDAVIEPLDLAARYVDDIARGKIPPRIEESWPGDFDKLKKNLDQCIGAVNALVADADMLSRAAVEGKLTTRADAARHQGDYRKVIEGVNRTLDAVIGPLGVAAKCVDAISKGAIPPKIDGRYAGDFEMLKNNLNQCIEAVNALVEDANELAAAAVAGKLSTRAEAGRHQGDFRKIVDGVNQTLEAVIAPVNEAAGVLEKLAQRDLRVRVSGDYQGEHARIKESLNATAEALHEALAQVAQSAGKLSSAAGQIASSSQAVATGASEQAASLEQTSSSLESMASMTKQSADNAQQANVLAQKAKGAAAEGTAAMGQMQGAMGKIRASAEGTSQIIKDINDIAFQTNLLALNAAVEAARAGEAGRGFAVVAEEVRSLALRSKEAAMKTEELIRQSVKEAGEGEVTSKHVSEKLTEIAQSVSKVTDIVAEIAAASKEQATGIEQVTKAVAEMDRVTQQNAANSEESSSAASELSSQSEELAAMVGSFQLGDRSQTLRPPQKKLAVAAASGARRDQQRPHRTQAMHLKPEDLIPLDSDPEFKEF